MHHTRFDLLFLTLAPVCITLTPVCTRCCGCAGLKKRVARGFGRGHRSTDKARLGLSLCIPEVSPAMAQLSIHSSWTNEICKPPLFLRKRRAKVTRSVPGAVAAALLSLPSLRRRGHSPSTPPPPPIVSPPPHHHRLAFPPYTPHPVCRMSSDSRPLPYPYAFCPPPLPCRQT